MAAQRAYLGGILVAVVFFCMAFPTQGVNLNIKSLCASPITVYSQSGSGQPSTQSLNPGASGTIGVGDSWEAGRVWAGNPNSALTSVAEFTIVANGQDTYDISNVNAYNIGIDIQPTAPSGPKCFEISCDIPNVQNFCTGANKYTGYENGDWEYCINVDGPQQDTQPPCCCATSNTLIFKNACPDAYSFSKDDPTSTFVCTGVTDYNIVFCPGGSSSNHHFTCSS